MIQFGIFQNGASDLPVTDTPSGVLVSGGSLEDMHASFQRIMVDQVRQGVLAEQLGYDFYFMTEHHFQPEGPEFSPNPLMAEMAIAAHTRRIRLGQATNTLTQWHPLRVAELGAMLDVISGGRVELGLAVATSRARSRSSGSPTARTSRTRSATGPTSRRPTTSSSRPGPSRPSRTRASSSPSHRPTPAGTMPRRSPTSASRTSAARWKTYCGSARRTSTAVGTRSPTPPPC